MDGDARVATAESPRLRAGAVLALALAAGTLAWILAGRGESLPTSPAAPGGRIATAAELAALSSSRRPLFWAGPQKHTSYELTESANGSVYIRYVPPDAVGSPRADFLAVATYPQPDAYARLALAAARPGRMRLPMPGGGLAVYDGARPRSVYLAFRGADRQIEVYHPDPREARRLVTEGQIRPIGAEPRELTQAQLLALSAAEGPLYWVGARSGLRYEVTRTDEGRVFVRYLSRGAQVGDLRPAFLSVGTYPQAHAYEQVRAAGMAPGSVTMKLGGGGIAVYRQQRPSSVHVAFPGSDRQIEVYHPDGAEALRLVRDGALRPIG